MNAWLLHTHPSYAKEWYQTVLDEQESEAVIGHAGFSSTNPSNEIGLNELQNDIQTDMCVCVPHVHTYTNC